MSGTITTVTGPVPAGDLGLTLMHEHMLCDLTRPEWRGQGANFAITLANRHDSTTGRWSRATTSSPTGPSPRTISRHLPPRRQRHR